MLKLYLKLRTTLLSRKTYPTPQRHTLYMRWVWFAPIIFLKSNSNVFNKHRSVMGYYLDPLLSPFRITWVFWKFYRNNRPRINTYYPVYFFTFGLMQRDLQLPTRNLSRANFKLVIVLWTRILLTPIMVWHFNYFSQIILYIQRAIWAIRRYHTLHFILPHHFTMHLKYKKYRSIKKWVKKSFYPNIYF